MARKVSKRAKGWIEQKIKTLRKERYSPKQSVAIALEEAKKYKLINSGEADEMEDELLEATEVSEGFHGREAEEEFEEIEEHQFRSELACLGDLVELEVVCVQQNEMKVLSFDRVDPVRLASSADRRQLFLIGGDQKLDEGTLVEMAENEQAVEKDKINIGYVYSISYFADKHHLTGPKQQKQGTEYIHAFGEQTGKKFGVEDKIAAGMLPCLIYDKLNNNMELVGGVYEVRDEGIWD